MLFSRHQLVTPKIVQPHASGKKWWLLLGLLLILLWSWVVYDYGRRHAGFDSGAAEQQTGSLLEEIAALNQQVEELRLSSASFERAGQIDRQAAQQAQQEFRVLQQERADLKKEVAFLNGLLTDKSMSAVLQLKNFAITGLSDKSRYALSFTLVHLTKVGGVVEGQLRLEVSGELNGKEKKLSLSEMTEKKLESMKMRFKNFQKFDADLVLPKDFRPEAVIISTELKSKKIESLQETIDWVVADSD